MKYYQVFPLRSEILFFIKIFFYPIIIKLFAQKDMGATKIWFLKTIAIKKKRLKRTYSNSKICSWSFSKD